MVWKETYEEKFGIIYLAEAIKEIENWGNSEEDILKQFVLAKVSCQEHG